MGRVGLVFFGRLLVFLSFFFVEISVRKSGLDGNWSRWPPLLSLFPLTKYRAQVVSSLSFVEGVFPRAKLGKTRFQLG